ncbi:hypothetical protein PINS_up012929 [Pythium insidiosum]|nr:hypothetical protein PINS_up012929 [Pythium insidiosum]
MCVVVSPYHEWGSKSHRPLLERGAHSIRTRQGYERLRLKYQPRIRYLHEHHDLRNALDAGHDPEDVQTSSDDAHTVQQSGNSDPEPALAPLSYSDDEDGNVELGDGDERETHEAPVEASIPKDIVDERQKQQDEATEVEGEQSPLTSEDDEADGLTTLVGVYFDAHIKRVITYVCWPLAHRGGGLQDASKRAPLEPIPEWLELEQNKYFAFMLKTLSWLFPGLPGYEAQEQTERDWKKDCEFDAFGTHGLSLEGFTISIMDLVTACTDGSIDECLEFLGQMNKRLETSLPVFRVPTTSALPPSNGDDDPLTVRDPFEPVIWQLVPLSTLIPCQMRPRPQFFELKAKLAVAPVIVLILAGDERCRQAPNY